jgi:hexokinase
VATGTEKGRFLAVDLGGSNCRICLVDLHGDCTFTVAQSKHRVPAAVMVNASYKPLFAFIAAKIADFLQAHVPSGGNEDQGRQDGRQRYRLGFTFSFTCQQTSLARGTLIHWDKGWDIPEAVGRDPCAMLQEAINDLGLPVLVSVLANDSTGTLLMRSYTSGTKNGSTLAAVIFGTGTNAAYVEKLSNIRGLDMKGGPDAIMVINTEWGCFDDEMKVLPRTPCDDELDANSTTPGSQMLEKRVSGLYLGELLRLAILRLLRTGSLHMWFDNSSPINQQWGIDSSFLSQLANDDTDEKAVPNVSDILSATNVTPNDVACIRLVSGAIAQRAARLAGASMAAIVIQSGRLDPRHRRERHPPLKVVASEKEVLCSDVGGKTALFHRFRLRLSRIFSNILASVGLGFLTKPVMPCPEAVEVPDDAKAETSHSLDGEEIIDIGADGSLIEFYPTFEMDMRAAIRDVPEIGCEGEKRIRIGLAKDGSGIGAALMAQAAALEDIAGELRYL